MEYGYGRFQNKFSIRRPFQYGYGRFHNNSPIRHPLQEPFCQLGKILQKLERRSSDARNAEQFECT
jgi:hypothetical protein